MSPENPVHSMRLSLQTIESQIGSGTLTPPGLDDLKSAIDDVRLRLWAIKSAQNMTDGAAALKRFRMRRAVEILDTVAEDLKDPQLVLKANEMTLLRGAAERFTSQLERSGSGAG